MIRDSKCANGEEDVCRKEEESCVLFLSCVYCGTRIHADKSDHRSNANLLSFKEKNENNEDAYCPKCSKKLPACSVCLEPIEVCNQVRHARRGFVASRSDLTKEEKRKGFNQRYYWCTKCRHGGHINHYLEWFDEFSVCPFSECKCKCVENKQESEMKLGV